MTAWRSRHRIPSDARTVGVVGRLSAVKGHAALIRRVPELLERVPRAILVLVGGGPLQEELTRLTAELGVDDRVRFVGNQSDVRTALGALDVVAIPSDHEGLSNVALEALAVGRPVVAFDVGGLPEALGRGAHGLLVPPRQFATFIDALVRVLEDPGLAASLVRDVASHLERFALDRHVQRQREIYCGLIRSLRARRGTPGSRSAAR